MYKHLCSQRRYLWRMESHGLLRWTGKNRFRHNAPTGMQHPIRFLIEATTQPPPGILTVPSFQRRSPISRHLSLLMSALIGAYCTGCTDGNKLPASGNPQRTIEGGSIAQAGSDASNSDKPSIHTSSNQAAPKVARSNSEGTPEHLKAESGFILNDGISSEAAGDLLRSSRTVSDAIDRMTRDAASSPDAQDLTKHYRSALTRAIGPSGVLDGFSCGLSICIGIARSRGNSDNEAWEHRLASDPSSPTYSYAEASEGIDGGYERRFIFSTDPALNSISGN